MQRRKFIQLVAASTISSACALDSGNVSADAPALTVAQQEGPFYPVEPIADSSNLLQPGFQGSELILSGAVLDNSGKPLSGARIEIWQCDARGVYKHPSAPATETFDRNFNGAGSTVTDSNGQYSFTTIVPVPYTGRPPHIHTKVFVENTEKLTSQIYLAQSGGHSKLKIDLSTSNDQTYAANFDFIIRA